MTSTSLEAGEVVFETWLGRARANAFGDELGPDVGESSANMLLHALDAATGGSGVPPSRDYFDPESCQALLSRSFDEAVAGLAAAQGPDAAAWTAPRPETVFRHPGLNESAYLDFYAPEILDTYPSLVAVYGIDTLGVTRYYPNINLASLLPPDFDPTSRGYYEITSPLFNPQKTARWSIPYVDAAGGGLVVTVAAPVYFGNSFGGIIAADMRLSTITSQIENIHIGRTGYAFMLDDAGRIISMPDEGYRLFGINPGDINPEEYFKQTVLNLGNEDPAECHKPYGGRRQRAPRTTTAPLPAAIPARGSP